FWSTTIADGIVQILGLFFLKETYAPILLERKAEKIRKDMDEEKANRMQIRTVFQTSKQNWTSFFGKSLVRPFALFIREPIVQALGLYMAFVYGQLYLFITTLPSIYEGLYHEKVGIAGLHYLALGVGLSGASQVNARMMDKIYALLKKRNGGVGKPEFRLPSIIPGTILLPVGLLLNGWTAQNRVFWLVPDIGTAFVGAGTILVFQSIQTYVLDCYTLHAASALAAVSFLRSIAGFGFPLFAPSMFNALGYGKGDTILAVVAIVIGCPAPWLLWYYGERLRAASRHARS
ncbi:MFS general substrate transporter, partial [Artomyces pyxidatus]